VSTDSQFTQIKTPIRKSFLTLQSPMSTARQSTRASSAAANGPTPALGPNLGPSSVPPTPARATPRRRRSAAPLPPLQGMPPRISHNYGTNDLPMGYTGSGSYRQSAGLESIRDVLQKELQPNVRPSGE